MSIADRIAEKVGAKYKAGDSDGSDGDEYADDETPDARALDCAKDAVRAVKANDPKAFLVAMRTLYSELGEAPPPDEE